MVTLFSVCTCALSLHDSVAALREKVAVEHEQAKQTDQRPKASYGYGGKFGVEKDRMDKVHPGILSTGGAGLFLSFPLRFGFSRSLWATTTLHKSISTPPRKMRRKGLEGSLVWRKIA